MASEICLIHQIRVHAILDTTLNFCLLAKLGVTVERLMARHLVVTYVPTSAPFKLGGLLSHPDMLWAMTLVIIVS